MVAKIRLSGDPMPEYGFTQNPFAPPVLKLSGPITLEMIADHLKTFVAVVGNYVLEHSIQEAREHAICQVIADAREYHSLTRKKHLTPQEEYRLQLYEERIQQYIDDHPELIQRSLAKSRSVGGRDSYYANDWFKMQTAVKKLCKALNIAEPKMPWLSSEDLNKLAISVCDVFKKDAWFKPPWTASKLLCVLLYNEVYHYYKALPDEQVTEELNEAVKEFDDAICSLKISLDWE